METLSIRSGRPLVTAGQKFLNALREDIELYRRYKNTRKQLSCLTDQELSDLHPTFRTVDDIAYMAVYGRLRPSRPELRLVR